MKKETLDRKLQRIESELDRIESGRSSDLSISYISDQIVWLRKFKYITPEECERLCNRVIYCLENNLCEFYK